MVSLNPGKEKGLDLETEKAPEAISRRGFLSQELANLTSNRSAIHLSEHFVEVKQPFLWLALEFDGVTIIHFRAESRV